jgi:hypothetical protein
MDETIDALKMSFDAFSRRLEAKLKNFKATGQLTDESEIAENLRKRYEATKTKLDLAIRAGDLPGIMKLEFDRALEALRVDLLRLERQFDTAAAKEAK